MDGHRLANYFPPITGDEFNELVKDIQKNGQLNPIILYEDKILDGKNRDRACQQLGITPITKVYIGADPLGFVISSNVMRRHLSESQRAMLAREMLPEFAIQIKSQKSERAIAQNNGSQGFKKTTRAASKNALREKDRSGEAAYQAGKQFGVSGSSVQKANRIGLAIESGELEPEIFIDIVKGKKTINAVDKELHDKRYIKIIKEEESKANKQLPNQYPKGVKEYIEFLREAKDKITLATKLKDEGMFSPEAMQFIKRLHNRIKNLMSEMEGIENEK